MLTSLRIQRKSLILQTIPGNINNVLSFKNCYNVRKKIQKYFYSTEGNKTILITVEIKNKSNIMYEVVIWKII